MGYKQTALKGITWIGLLRFVTRAVAYVKIAIIARILTPHQFGLFGIAGLALIFLETLTETGINVFLIQEENFKKYINTAWIVSIVRGILISFVIFSSAPLVSKFFNSSGSYRLLLLISLVPLMRGFINPSVIKYRKNLEFKKEFLFKSSLFLIESAVTIVFTLLTKETSSIVYGLIAGAMFEILISYIFVKPIPKLSFKKEHAKKIIRRGKWITLSGVFNYLAHQGDDIVVGYLLNPTFLGLYQNAFKISSLPLTEVAQVTTQVTFPIYSKFSKDLKRLKKAYGKVLILSSLIVVPLGLIFYLFPKQVILIILGEGWLEAADALRILSIYGVFKAFLNTTKSVFHSLKRQKVVARLAFFEFLGLLIVIIPLVKKYQIVGAGYASVVSVVVVLPVAIIYLSKLLRSSNEKKYVG